MRVNALGEAQGHEHIAQVDEALGQGCDQQG